MPEPRAAQPLDLDAAKAALRARLAELTAESEASRDSRRPVEVDQQTVGRLSRMDAMQAQAMALAAEERRQIERQRIDAALRRIAEGEYGFCLGCGEEIAPERVRLDPTATLCLACAQIAAGGNH